MTTEVRYVPFAINDLEEIYEYIAFETKSERIASGVIRRIQETARTFATQPNAGTRCDELIPGGRYFVVRNYVVITCLDRSGSKFFRSFMARETYCNIFVDHPTRLREEH
jgi:plasmid stabilization system protein ParE